MLILCESMPVIHIEVVKILQILRVCVAAEVPEMLLVRYSTSGIMAPNLKGLI